MTKINTINTRTMNSEPLIRVENLSFSYSLDIETEDLVLNSVNLNICEGDCLSIIGPNGGGKSTLIKLLLRLIKPTKGKIEYHSLLEKPKSMGYIPQIPLFDRTFPLRVRDLVVMGLIGDLPLGRFYRSQDYRKSEEILESLELSHLKKHYISEISGGELQRVLLARALVSSPKILFLDECTSMVDLKAQYGWVERIRKLRKDITLVLVSHDMGVVAKTALQIACLNKKLYYHGDPKLPSGILEKTYGCPVELLAHGSYPHRVLNQH